MTFFLPVRMAWRKSSRQDFIGGIRKPSEKEVKKRSRGALTDLSEVEPDVSG